MFLQKVLNVQSYTSAKQNAGVYIEVDVIRIFRLVAGGHNEIDL